MEAYLDYYCGLSAPGFAVLLKGEWGSGKTWFIKRFINKYRRENLKDKKQKFLYVSLYGVTSFLEIEDTFFQQLNPVLSSKEMAITGKILKGLLKGTLKIDLNGDSKDDGALNIQIPDINLPDYLKNTDKSILIFDDLERCQMDIGNILGYINYFVEQQDLKVVIVANENELLKQDKYNTIKEKLIGKTFGVAPDFDGSLENFICSVNNLKVRTFLTDNGQLMQEVYKTAECENLRILKQIVLDFERIFEKLPEKGRSKPDFLKDILKLLMAFSIEIRRGKMLPKDISKLREEYILLISKQQSSRQATSSSIKKNSAEEAPLQIMLGKYTVLNLNLHEPFPSKVWWEIFFDKGILDTQELDQSLLTSKYFQDEHTPNWVRLWHFYRLTDNDFDDLLKKVELQYVNREFTVLGEIKHITGLLLKFSDVGLYCKTKEEIIQDSKLYIDHLKDNNQLDIVSPLYSLVEDNYGGLIFQGREINEFTDFCSYIDQVRESARDVNLPSAGKDLLVIMQSDIWKFNRMVCQNNSHNGDSLKQRYYDVPIFKHILPEEFIEKFLPMDYKDRDSILSILKQRYELVHIHEKLLEELDWLKSVRSLLLEKAECKKGKVSGYWLKFLTEHYLNEVIQKLEAKSS
nr:P-loop NTPase fold protein [Cylindrospermum stagnale]